MYIVNISLLRNKIFMIYLLQTKFHLEQIHIDHESLIISILAACLSGISIIISILNLKYRLHTGLSHWKPSIGRMNKNKQNNIILFLQHVSNINATDTITFKNPIYVVCSSYIEKDIRYFNDSYFFKNLTYLDKVMYKYISESRINKEQYDLILAHCYVNNLTLSDSPKNMLYDRKYTKAIYKLIQIIKRSEFQICSNEVKPKDICIPVNVLLTIFMQQNKLYRKNMSYRIIMIKKILCKTNYFKQAKQYNRLFKVIFKMKNLFTNHKTLWLYKLNKIRYTSLKRLIKDKHLKHYIIIPCCDSKTHELGIFIINFRKLKRDIFINRM